MANYKEWTILHLSLFITFIVSGLCINFVQAVVYLLIGTWNKTLFRKLNFYFIWMIYAQVSALKGRRAHCPAQATF